MKYRKKPVEVEAVQFNTVEDLAFITDFRTRLISNGNEMALEIPTLEGTMVANIGDWIIKGIAGEFYPVRNDIFEETYEKVEEV